MTFEYTIIEDAWTAKNREIAELRAEIERLRAALEAHHAYMPDGDLDPCVICDGAG